MGSNGSCSFCSSPPAAILILHSTTAETHQYSCSFFYSINWNLSVEQMPAFFIMESCRSSSDILYIRCKIQNRMMSGRKCTATPIYPRLIDSQNPFAALVARVVSISLHYSCKQNSCSESNKPRNYFGALSGEKKGFSAPQCILPPVLFCRFLLLCIQIKHLISPVLLKEPAFPFCGADKKQQFALLTSLPNDYFLSSIGNVLEKNHLFWQKAFLTKMKRGEIINLFKGCLELSFESSPDTHWKL